MSQKYNKLIRYTICETIYDQMAKTQYTSFTTLCKNLGDCVLKDISIQSKDYDIITEIVGNLALMFDESDDNMQKYLVKFFEDEEWRLDIDFIKVIKKNTNFSTITKNKNR